jgi:CheY-like chemotaxis protein
MHEPTILVVEDNEDDVFALRWALKKAKIGNPVQIVTDGQMAVHYLDARGAYSDREQYPLPSFIFLDLKLPYRNGFEVLAWLRAEPHFDNIPVVILSGSDEERDHERAQALGISAYLVKPATVEQLRSSLKLAGILPIDQDG